MRETLAASESLWADPTLQLPPVPASDAQARAMLEVAEAINRHAQACQAAADAMRPAAETVHGMGARLDALCDWLKNKGPWFLASTPLVLVAIQAISPEAGKALSAVLAGLAR